MIERESRIFPIFIVTLYEELSHSCPENSSHPSLNIDDGEEVVNENDGDVDEEEDMYDMLDRPAGPYGWMKSNAELFVVITSGISWTYYGGQYA